MENKCIIVGSGDFFVKNLAIEKGDFIIAVDGGFNHLTKNNITPHLLIGDFDSITSESLNVERIKNVEIIKYKKEKNETDMFLAIDKAVEMGYNNLHIHGGTGGRFSHTVANIQCLVHLKQLSVDAKLFFENEIAMVIKNEKIHFGKEMKGYISLFSLSSSCLNVNIENLKYQASNITLTNAFPLGVSNEFVLKDSSVSVEEGLMLIVFENRGQND